MVCSLALLILRCLSDGRWFVSEEVFNRLHWLFLLWDLLSEDPFDYSCCVVKPLFYVETTEHNNDDVYRLIWRCNVPGAETPASRARDACFDSSESFVEEFIRVKPKDCSFCDGVVHFDVFDLGNVLFRRHYLGESFVFEAVVGEFSEILGGAKVWPRW